MSPSVAEALRAVFAAFLWHEGVVHDAMACASFLKFHPQLPKQGSLVVTRPQPEALPDRRRQELTKEERARQRHSVEVTGNYLHIQPSTLESLTRSAANASANRNRRKLNANTSSYLIKENVPLQQQQQEEGQVEVTGAFGNYSKTISVLPPALNALVYLWEDLTSNCVQAINQQLIATSPVHHLKFRRHERGNGKGEKQDKEGKKGRKKKNSARNYIGMTRF